MSNMKDWVWPLFLTPRRKNENTTCGGVFWTKFKVFGNVVKHSLECLVDLLNRNENWGGNGEKEICQLRSDTQTSSVMISFNLMNYWRFWGYFPSVVRFPNLQIQFSLRSGDHMAAWTPTIANCKPSMTVLSITETPLSLSLDTYHPVFGDTQHIDLTYMYLPRC